MREATSFLRKRPAKAVRASPTAGLRPQDLWRSAAIMVAAAGFLSLAGAFGTEPAPLATRFAFWFGLLALGTGANRLVHVWLARRSTGGRPLMKAVLVSIGVAVLMTPVVMLLIRLAFGQREAGWGVWTYVAIANLTISTAVATLNVLAEGAAPAQVRTADAVEAAPVFLKRLPPRLRGAALYAVEAEDHYLRVHTSAGSDLILMRLADALSELEGLPGARTHRSWWVCGDAVEGVRRENGRTFLKLRGDLEAPISRTHLPAVRDQGWIS